MRFFKIVSNGYVVAIGTGIGGCEIGAAEYSSLLKIILKKPIAERGFDYRLKEDLTWELYKLPAVADERTLYTAEQLAEMDSDELKTVCAGLGISGSMTKANMISLILTKQHEGAWHNGT